MIFTKDQQEAIDNLAAMFFESTRDIIAASYAIQDYIGRRMQHVEKRKAREADNGKQADATQS